MAKTVEELTLPDMENARAAIEYYYEKGWTDGLPIVPPVEEFVAEFLAQTQRRPNDNLLTQAHLNRTCDVRQAAINAVMAGCLPEYFPVLLAVLDAFSDLNAGGGLLQSTTGQAPMIIVNGPVADALNINYRENLFGPGDRANATIGRALRLIILNVLGVKPHEFDHTTQGTPAKYGVCIAENEADHDRPHAFLPSGGGAARAARPVLALVARSELGIDNVIVLGRTLLIRLSRTRIPGTLLSAGLAVETGCDRLPDLLEVLACRPNLVNVIALERIAQLVLVVGPAVPRIGVATGRRDRALASVAPDPDRRVRTLDR